MFTYNNLRLGEIIMWRRWCCRGGPFWLFGILILGIIIIYHVFLIMLLFFSFHTVILLIEICLFFYFLTHILWF